MHYTVSSPSFKIKRDIMIIAAPSTNSLSKSIKEYLDRLCNFSELHLSNFVFGIKFYLLIF